MNSTKLLVQVNVEAAATRVLVFFILLLISVLARQCQVPFPFGDGLNHPSPFVESNV